MPTAGFALYVRKVACKRTGVTQGHAPLFAQDCLLVALRAVPAGGKVLDIGCLGLSLYSLLKADFPDLHLSGCDRISDQAIPDDMIFQPCDLESGLIPFGDDLFDLVVCSHVLEHVRNPVDVYGEAVRVTRPGGRIFVEAPSDRSTRFSFPFLQDWHLILSFYDDPTHVGRPWTPQAFSRMAIYWGVEAETSAYAWSLLHWLTLIPAMAYFLASKQIDRLVNHWWKATGWVCFGLARKPADQTGKPDFNYFSFKGR